MNELKLAHCIVTGPGEFLRRTTRTSSEFTTPRRAVYEFNSFIYKN